MARRPPSVAVENPVLIKSASRSHVAFRNGSPPSDAPLRVCADPARQCSGLDDASTSPAKVGLCPMHCLLCTACPACNVVLLNALLCVHGAHACILSCSVLLMLACSCRFSLTALAGLHVAMPFEWCVQAFPSGHVGPPALNDAARTHDDGRNNLLASRS